MSLNSNLFPALPAPTPKHHVTMAFNLVREAREKLIKLATTIGMDPEKNRECIGHIDNADAQLQFAHRQLGKGLHTVTNCLQAAIDDLHNARACAPAWAARDIGSIRELVRDARGPLTTLDAR